jgi:ABC-type histidine transport system ATPase subunit
MKVDKALKVIPEAITNDLRAMENLRQEARTMIRLNHNILYGFTYLPLNSLEMLKIVS